MANKRIDELTQKVTLHANDYLMIGDSEDLDGNGNPISKYILGSIAASTATLQTAFDAGQTITIADNDNQTLAIVNNDTTNDTDTLTIDQNNEGYAIDIDFDCNDGSDKSAMRINAANAGAGDAGALHIDTGYIQIDDITAPSTTTNRLYANGGSLYWNANDLTAGGSLQSSFDAGQTITIADNDNQTLAIVNNDTTNDTDTITIDQNNEGYAIDIDFDCNNASDFSAMRINAANAGAGDAGALYIDTGYIQIDNITAPSTTTNRLYANGGNLYWNAVNLTTDSRTVVTKTSGYTANTGEDVLVTCSSADITITLPAASGNSGKTILVSKRDATAYNVIVDGDSTETINGSLTHVISTQYDSFEYCCDGSNWYIR